MQYPIHNKNHFSLEQTINDAGNRNRTVDSQGAQRIETRRWIGTLICTYVVMICGILVLQFDKTVQFFTQSPNYFVLSRIRLPT